MTSSRRGLARSNAEVVRDTVSVGIQYEAPWTRRDDLVELVESRWTSADILDGKTWILVRTNSGAPGTDESNHGGICPATVKLL